MVFFLKTCHIVKLTVLWESVVDEVFEWKTLKYAELVAQVKQNGWHAEVLPVEVACRGFVVKIHNQSPNKDGSKRQQLLHGSDKSIRGRRT